MNTRTSRRTGLSLTEVLVALFIMAVGMIALLTMFPLGAMQISQAIKDERSAQAGNNADNIMRAFWRQYVVEALKNGRTERDLVNPYVSPGVPNPNYVQFMTAMEDPNFDVADSTIPAGQWPVSLNRSSPSVMPALSDVTTGITFAANMSLPSYPVFVDPYGELSRITTMPASRRWVSGVHPTATGGFANVLATESRMPRRSLNFPNGIVAAGWQYRYATLMDDIDFGDDGLANQNGTGVARSGRYNWAWVLQRPTQGNRLVTDMQVVVYDQRAFNFARFDDEVAYTVEVNTAVSPALVGFVPGMSTVSFRYDIAANLPAPAIRSGQWIMDGTITAPSPALPSGIRNANFYRVTSVTDSNPGGTSGLITLDLQSPIKQPAGQTVTNYPGQLYVLRGVAEVFERRQLTTDDAPVIP